MAPVCAVVVAGGSGQSFGNPGGKQLVNVAGRPLMSWSIRAFDRSDKVGHIVVVCPAERRAEMRRLAISPYSYNTPISFADAGETRQDSTRAGVHAVPAGFEYVAIHDGARPLITTEAIDHAIDVLVSDRALDGVVRSARDRYAQDRRWRQHRRDAAARALLGRADAADL